MEPKDNFENRLLASIDSVPEEVVTETFDRLEGLFEDKDSKLITFQFNPSVGDNKVVNIANKQDRYILNNQEVNSIEDILSQDGLLPRHGAIKSLNLSYNKKFNHAIHDFNQIGISIDTCKVSLCERNYPNIENRRLLRYSFNYSFYRLHSFYSDCRGRYDNEIKKLESNVYTDDFSYSESDDTEKMSAARREVARIMSLTNQIRENMKVKSEKKIFTQSDIMLMNFVSELIQKRRK